MQKGEIIRILVLAAAAKALCLTLIAGLLQPDSGKIDVRGDNAGSGRIGYIFQQDALLPWRTVQDNMLIATDYGACYVKRASQRYCQTISAHV